MQGFYFCGKYSRSAKTTKELGAAKLIDEIFEYANTSYFGSTALLQANIASDLIYLNPDIEYYFSKLVNPLLKDEMEPRDVSHLVPLLSKQQIEFLDEAVRQNDLQSVLDTTNSCKTK